jgi:hypothetical protein
MCYHTLLTPLTGIECHPRCQLTIQHGYVLWKFTPHRQVIIKNIGCRFEAVHSDILTGRERILRDARSHLEMMQEEL